MPPVDPNVNYTGLKTRTYRTFATLPAANAGNAGSIEYITDANAQPAQNFGQTATGGGTYRAKVRSDGSAWKYHGTYFF